MTSTPGQEGGERTPEATPKALARTLMLTHTFCFPEDMAAEEMKLKQRMQTTEGLLLAVFSRLEFEVVEAIKTAVAAEREACAKIVEDEGPCRHVDHVQGFCACAEKAAAVRARREVAPPSPTDSSKDDL